MTTAADTGAYEVLHRQTERRPAEAVDRREQVRRQILGIVARGKPPRSASWREALLRLLLTVLGMVLLLRDWST